MVKSHKHMDKRPPKINPAKKMEVSEEIEWKTLCYDLEHGVTLVGPRCNRFEELKRKFEK